MLNRPDSDSDDEFVFVKNYDGTESDDEQTTKPEELNEFSPVLTKTEIQEQEQGLEIKDEQEHHQSDEAQVSSISDSPCSSNAAPIAEIENVNNSALELTCFEPAAQEKEKVETGVTSTLTLHFTDSSDAHTNRSVFTNSSLSDGIASLETTAPSNSSQAPLLAARKSQSPSYSEKSSALSPLTPPSKINCCCGCGSMTMCASPAIKESQSSSFSSKMGKCFSDCFDRLLNKTKRPTDYSIKIH
ncbi:MAG: hypothetical protein ABI370_00525 [Gammaproteobacteria bacterium]